MDETRNLTATVLAVAKIMGGVKEGVASGGSTTTLVDENDRQEPAETFDGGFLAMLSGNNNQRLIRINSYAEGAFTFDTQSAACANLDRYAVVPPNFPLDDIISAINTALQDFGDYLQNDETLTTDSDLQVYTLPDGVSNVKRFEVAQETTSPYSYKEQYFWEEKSGYIYFLAGKEPSTSDRKIRLWYIGSHDEMVDYDDELDTEIDMRWLKWASAVNLYRSYYSQYGEADPHRVQLMNEAMQTEMAERVRAVNRITRGMARTSRIGSW